MCCIAMIGVFGSVGKCILGLWCFYGFTPLDVFTKTIAIGTLKEDLI